MAKYDKLIDLDRLSLFKDKADALYAKGADLSALSTKVDGLVTAGGEPNKLESVSVNGTKVTISSAKDANVTAVEGSVNGAFSLAGQSIKIHGLGSAAYTASSAYDAAGAAAGVLGKNTDAATANTVYGAKAAAAAAQSTADTANSKADENTFNLTVTTNAVNKKQDKLTAGTNITISGSTISAKDTVYTLPAASASTLGGIKVGSNLTVTEDGTLSGTPDTKYTAGTNLSLSGTQFSLKASPALSGTPTAPTAAAGTSTTQIATTAFVATAVAAAIGGVTQIKYSVVSELPAKGEAGVIYLVAHAHGAGDAYDEYIWLGSAYEKLGNTDIDLTPYVKSADITLATDAEVTALFG